jgi:hypothetical protein
VDGVTVDFGTSGKLYKGDLLMYDRQTHSLWAQMEGRAVVGNRAGTRFPRVPANTIAYEDFKAIFPQGRVLSRETGHQRAYGRNPYSGYDEPDSLPFLFRRQLDRRGRPRTAWLGSSSATARRRIPGRLRSRGHRRAERLRPRRAASFRNIRREEIAVVLLHAGSVILPELPESPALFAQRLLAKRGVELRLNTRLHGATAEALCWPGGERICITEVAEPMTVEVKGVAEPPVLYELHAVRGRFAQRRPEVTEDPGRQRSRYR